MCCVRLIRRLISVACVSTLSPISPSNPGRAPHDCTTPRAPPPVLDQEAGAGRRCLCAPLRELRVAQGDTFLFMTLSTVHIHTEHSNHDSNVLKHTPSPNTHTLHGLKLHAGS